jgi:hypothetical protein
MAAGSRDSRDVGRGTRGDIGTFVPQALSRYGYAVANFRETPTLIYFETAWEHRAPFEDEVEAGAEECRTRILVEARKGGADFYSVTLRVENSALTMSLDDERWVPMEATKMFDEHVDEIVSVIQMNIDAGVRLRG